MNNFQKIVNRNVKRFIKVDAIETYIIPRKKGKLYKRWNGKMISNRATVKMIRHLIKEKLNGRTISEFYDRSFRQNGGSIENDY